MEGLTLGGSDHMDNGDTVLASRLLTDAADWCIFHRSRVNLVCYCEGFGLI